MKELWIVNITKQDHQISDLGIIVRSMKSINLLCKNLKLDRYKIIESIEKGSICSKKGKLFIRYKNNNIDNRVNTSTEKNYIPSRSKSIIDQETIEIKIDDEDLDKKKSDEKFIQELIMDEGE
ncbi:MAG: hypothetical protein LC122_13115 [Chitinophagales bacterium]|nr:hypothetical protein [Chitinophagales bacterium]